MLKRITARPWLVFLILGGVVYALLPSEEDQAIAFISQSQVETSLQEFARQFPGQVGPETRERIIDRLYTEEVLVQEALGYGFDNLPVVRDRLKKLASFLQLGDEQKDSEEELIARAKELGLLQSDTVIRRYLVSTMEQSLVNPRVIPVSPEEIQAYFDANAADFERPARLDLVQVFFSSDKNRTAQDVAAAQKQISAGQLDEEQAIRLGDVFFSGYRFPSRSESQLAAQFGGQFAAAVMELPEGQWQGPIVSAYGLHLVKVQNKVPASLPPIEEVAERIADRVRREKAKVVLDEKVKTLRERYDLQVES